MPNPKEVTLTDLLDAVVGLRSSIKRQEAQIQDLQDTLDELVTKVDEINLPVGEGFTTTYES